MSRAHTIWKKDHPYNKIKKEVNDFRKSLIAMSNEELDDAIVESFDGDTKLLSLSRSKKIKTLVSSLENEMKTSYFKKKEKEKDNG